MKNKIKIVIIVVIGVSVLFFLYLVFAWGKGLWPFEAKYQVVTLVNGEVYYGRLSFFPSPKLIDAWFFQQTPSAAEEETPGINLVPFNSLFFGPENVLYLEKDQIIWWADLKQDSQIVKFIENQKGGSPAQVPSTQIPQQPEE